MRVATLTLNPAIDQTITVARLIPGDVHRAHALRRDAGGKGVNVASCLADWGVPAAAFGLLGADNAALFEALCADKPIEDRFLRVPGETRVNLKIVDDVGTTDINMDGPPVDAAQIDTVVARIAAFAADDALVILSGSLPPGCPQGLYADLVARLKGTGAQVLLDTSGLPLTLALDAAPLPDIIKPNRQELTTWCGEALERPGDVARVAARLHKRGIGLVVVSMGKDGALFLSSEGARVASLPAGTLASTVGAGDAMVAGIASALVEGAGLERIARLSTAFAVAKLGQPGPHLPDLPTVHALAAHVAVTAVEQTDTQLAGEAQ